MPLRDPDAKRAYQKLWYGKNAEWQARLAAERRRRYRARNAEIVRRAVAGRCEACGSEDELHLLVRKRELSRLGHRPCSEARLREAVASCPLVEGKTIDERK